MIKVFIVSSCCIFPKFTKFFKITVQLIIVYFTIIYRNKSPKKPAKGGVQVRKEKSKDIVKPTVLKKEGEKIKVVTPPNPEKLAQQEFWAKAIQNVSSMTNLSAEESSIAKLLGDYKNKASIPQRKIKLKVRPYLIDINMQCVSNNILYIFTEYDHKGIF